MKKYIVGLAGTIAFAMSFAYGQSTALASSVHTVEAGDTLWEIARANDISVEDLLTWNHLDSALIFPKQELKIESKIETYTVQKGDTLSSIADSHQIPLATLMTWNNIKGYLIHPGDELALEGKKVATPSTNVKSNTTPAKESTKDEETAEASPAPPVVETPAPSPAEGEEMSVTATAYTAYCQGCSGITYTGIDLRSNPNQKVIAVDPNLIPLGSRVWVEGYGEAIAGDIGGAIKGNIIDVFLENQQDALNWGRKTVTIKILN